MATCETCKHWERWKDENGHPIDWGQCAKISTHGGEQNAVATTQDLQTAPEFGCLLWDAGWTITINGSLSANTEPVLITGNPYIVDEVHFSGADNMAWQRFKMVDGKLEAQE